MIDRLLRVALLGSTWVLYLLMVLSVVSIATMLDRWLYFRKHKDDTKELRAKLSQALFDQDFEAAERALEGSTSLEARVVRIALPWARGGADAFADAVDSEAARMKKHLEKGTNLLGTIGNNAPFVGLFGTVLGVIEAFHHLADGQNKAAMGNVMAGIAEALVATGVGLFVALPAVVAYNIAQKKIGDIESGIASLAKLVTAGLKLKDRTEKSEPSPKSSRREEDPDLYAISRREQQNGHADLAQES